MPRGARRLGIEPYIGYGTASRLVLSGRVLEERGPIPSAATDSRWRNLRNTFRRFATREVAGVRVSARYAGLRASGVTDGEGYFRIEFDLGPSTGPGPWERIELAIEESRP